jgi:hypothetical protein
MAYGRRRAAAAFGAARRTKKIRSPIRVKERIAKKGGKCAACRARYEPGDLITVVNVKRRTYHRSTCVPANVGAAISATTGGPIAAQTAAQVAQAFSINWSPGEARMVAMLGMENAMAINIKKGLTVVTPELDKAFKTYNSCKNTAMHVPSGGQTGATESEKKQAIRVALINLVKLVF